LRSLRQDRRLLDRTHGELKSDLQRAETISRGFLGICAPPSG
jgi:hypothetical protein